MANTVGSSHSRLRVPANWQGEERTLVERIDALFDQLFLGNHAARRGSKLAKSVLPVVKLGDPQTLQISTSEVSLAFTADYTGYTAYYLGVVGVEYGIIPNITAYSANTATVTFFPTYTVGAHALILTPIWLCIPEEPT